MSNVTFRPVRGKESSILALGISEGCTYFATDTGKIYIDTDTERIAMGGSGAAIHYGRASDLVEDENTALYHYPKVGLENPNNIPKTGDIILNGDGKFFRVINIMDSYFQCSLIAVSGSGDGSGGGSTGKLRPTLMLEPLSTYNLINGQDARVVLTATSAMVNGVELAKQIIVSWNLSYTNAAGAEEIYHKDQKTVESGVPNFIDFGKYLRESTNTKVSLQASALNHEAESWIQTFSVTTSNLELSHVSSFSPTNRYEPTNVVLNCNAAGNTPKILDFYFDGDLVEHRSLAANAISTQSYTVPSRLCTHGHHKVRIELHQDLDGTYGLSVTPLEFEIPVVATGNRKPIIWLGDYQSVYYNYDSIQIPFLVYDPADTTKAVVHLYKGGIELDSSPRTITEFNRFSYWEIADADLNQLNYYQISCGEDETLKVQREITFTVEKDPNRDMTIVKQDNLKLNFDPTGRSNSESITNRAIWKYDNIVADFNNFNWFNNGWFMDNDINQTCLRISNGAQFTIPFGALSFGTSDAAKQSNSVEMQFKIRNIQDYSNLITNITRYTINGASDDSWYEQFVNQNEYTNYDAFLQAKLTPEQYESLEFAKVQKNINLENVVVGFYDKIGDNSVEGICVGPQDTFFSNGTNTVNVSFVEDDMINLSFVYSHSLKLLFIYINGCITGVIKSDKADFSIDSGNIVINSKYCDIDLYKLRIYNTDLNVNDIAVNYAVDRKDIETYDQNALATENIALKEYQLQLKGDAGVEAYNEAHPNDPLMPYIIYDSSDFSDNRLPWSKQITRNIKVEFVNTPLERAYASGELEQLAREDGLISTTETDTEKVREAVKLYYKHHCPSWISTMKADDRVEIVVQGTSSEFYPRRNFKIKTKVKDVNVWDDEAKNEDGSTGAYVEDDVLNMYMHMGPYAEQYKDDSSAVLEDPTYYGHEKSRLSDGWYMNNYTNATDRWTMKVDYMESSGSYNAGYATMIANAYSKHPLQDYLKNNVIVDSADQLKPVVKALSSNIRWQDYRTSVAGFPVMAFQKRADGSYLFIGYYRMLLDKGSDECYGFKPGKKVVSKLFKDKDGKDKRVRDIAECWEFSTNSRTFCSFKDPWNRVKFSFKAPIGADNEFTADMAPVAMNHFEYRYHWAEDYLDDLMAYKSLDQDKLNKLMKDLREDTGNADIPDLVAYVEGDKENPRAAQEITLSFYKNYEDMCAWVWSTNIDNVSPQGTYSEEPIRLGAVMYEPDKYYIRHFSDEGVETFVKATGDFEEGVTYLKQTTDSESGNTIYVNAHVVNDESLVYQPNKYYQKISGTYSLVSDINFSDTIDYYIFTSYSDEELAEKADLLVKPADVSVGFDSSVTYYIYDGSKTVNPKAKSGAVEEVLSPNEEDFNAGKYYVANPVSYVKGIEYKYDTQEYRSAKFMNELTKHFDPEYLATYFIATEVFECYDSRGKNCMMASWGPHVEGGEYIWYPIFYDIDTQLGINNTGIPSFEFNVDATEAGNYSTSDSILWNNFYKFFKNSYILTKYQNMRGTDTPMWNKLTNPPLQSVDYIEKWYRFDPETTKNIACRGKRPLIATNLDMYWKYITITNNAAIDQGVGYLLGQDGVMSQDKAGAYFYALQGDRSQSRRQFLTNRLEYIDSWLNQGNYARAGNNRIRGRISANNISGNGIEDVHSDKWIETDGAPYWKDKEFGEKSHEFDGQYWLDLTPIRSSYVTAGDDSANYPSQKYDGINTAKFKLNELEQGIRASANYPEQLLYIYGMNQMQDVGDMSKLYWTEFFLEGTAPKLTRLKLGHDGLSTTDPGTKWYNKKLNGITLPDLPLLKEANFCNIGLTNETTLHLSASEKLENFRATGTSKLVNVEFADGVALNTLYLPASVTNLTLTQANLLTDLIIEPEKAVPETIDGELVATPGLYLEGFFGDSYTSQISSINLNGGALGYNSYTLLKRFYNVKLDDTGTGIAMTDVKWSPFTRMADGDLYDSHYAYYKDNGHYQFEWYDATADNKEFNALIHAGEMYRAGPYKKLEDNSINNDRYLYFNDNYEPVTVENATLYIDRGNIIIGDECYEMLLDLYDNTNFNGASSTSRPTLSGIVFIENDNAIEESDIRELQDKYPEMIFFFKNVQQAYSARFIIQDNETGFYEYVKFKTGVTSIPSVQKIKASEITESNKIRFTSPFELYTPEKTHYDFLGWSNVPNPKEGDIILAKPGENESDPWLDSSIGLIEVGKYDYTYYAIFTIHEYNLNFYNYDGKTLLETIKVPYGQKAKAPTLIPYRDDSALSLYQSYDFQGYSLALNGNTVDVSTITVSNDEEFYASFKLIEDIRTIVHPEWFNFIATEYSDTNYEGGNTYGVTGYEVSPKVSLQGKIVIPRTYNNAPVIAVSGFGGSLELPQMITHVFMQIGEGMNPVVAVRYAAFQNLSTLKYFEFENSSVRAVENRAFQNCNLDAQLLNLQDTNLIYVGDYGFNAGISASERAYIKLPSSLCAVSQHCFTYLSCFGGINLDIGSENKLSKLNLSYYPSIYKFIQNEGGRLTVNFYSEIYDSDEDLIESAGFQVYECFGINVDSISVY